jgi:hypothetical protein
MSTKMCIDAHLIGKNTLALYRSLLTFSGALFITMNNDTYQPKPEIFENFDVFEREVVKLPVDAVGQTPVDIAALP